MTALHNATPHHTITPLPFLPHHWHKQRGLINVSVVLVEVCREEREVPKLSASLQMVSEVGWDAKLCEGPSDRLTPVWGIPTYHRPRQCCLIMCGRYRKTKLPFKFHLNNRSKISLKFHQGCKDVCTDTAYKKGKIMISSCFSLWKLEK